MGDRNFLEENLFKCTKCESVDDDHTKIIGLQLLTTIENHDLTSSVDVSRTRLELCEVIKSFGWYEQV